MNIVSNNPVKSLNRLTLIGNIGKDIALVKAGDKQYCRLSIATSETIFQDRQAKEVTTWHNVTLWDKQADFASNHLKKGSKVILDGKMVAKTYTNKEGKQVYSYEIRCQQIELYTAQDVLDS
jgi:single-strand DNA-binding protein